MQTFVHRLAIVGAIAGCIVTAVSAGAIAQGTESAANPVPDYPSGPPPLQLSDAQRAQIRAAVNQENTDVNDDIKKLKSPADPAVGAKLAKGLQAHPLPRPLIYEVPVLKEYTYLKYQDQILIVNSITQEIVEIIPQK